MRFSLFVWQVIVSIGALVVSQEFGYVEAIAVILWGMFMTASWFFQER